MAGQRSTLRPGVARWIDRYAEGRIDTRAFAPRVTRLRQRLARLEAPRQARADEAAVQGDVPLIIGRLEDCAATLRDGLEAADWASQRDLIRTLVKRVAVARDDVNVVCRIDPYPSDTDPGKKSWQLCRGSNATALRCPTECGVMGPVLDISCLEEMLDQAQKPVIMQALPEDGEEELWVDGIEAACDIALDEPSRPIPRVLDRVEGGMAPSIGTETIGVVAELRLVVCL